MIINNEKTENNNISDKITKNNTYYITDNYVCYNEDCIKTLNDLINKNLQVDMIFTDPPYKITSRGNHGSMGGLLKKEITKKGKMFKHNNIFIETYLPLLYKVLKEGGHCYIMVNHINLIHFLKVIDEWKDENKQGFHFIKCLIWDKKKKIAGTFYMNQFEYIIFLRKGKAVRINNCGTSDIISVGINKSKDENGKNLHDTEKPVEMIETLILNSSNENEIILDPFMGIGSCGIAALKNNRKFIGIEIDKNYYNIAIDRLNK